MADDVDRARGLLGEARLNHVSEKMLAAAQVHATLAVEAAVRDLIALMPEPPCPSCGFRHEPNERHG